MFGIFKGKILKQGVAEPCKTFCLQSEFIIIFPKSKYRYKYPQISNGPLIAQKFEVYILVIF